MECLVMMTEFCQVEDTIIHIQGLDSDAYRSRLMFQQKIDTNSVTGIQWVLWGMEDPTTSKVNKNGDPSGPMVREL